MSAATFFHPASIAKRDGVVKQAGEVRPVESRKFVEFLKNENKVQHVDNRVHQIRHLLARMESNNLLVSYRLPKEDVLLPKCYYCLAQPTKFRKKGALWLAKTLGGRYVYGMVSPAVVQIVGQNDDGVQTMGCGIVFDTHHVLTCKHVVTDMCAQQVQYFQGNPATIEDIAEHNTVDVAVLFIKEELQPTLGLAFFRPEISQKIYRFGHGRIPLTKETSPIQPTIESGEVTSPSKLTFDGSELFFYSAVSRPGDSGGAIVSDDGYVVGMTTRALDENIDSPQQKGGFLPHFGAIPSDVIFNAVQDLDIDVNIPYETFE